MNAGVEAELAQYTAVAIGGRALLIKGPTGCGKSSLALALIDRGATLIGDDGVALSTSNQQLIASPPPTTEGKIEIRNVGIVDLRSTSAPVALLLRVDLGARRFVEQAERSQIAGHSIPTLSFHLGNPADPIRAEYALSVHGLSW